MSKRIVTHSNLQVFPRFNKLLYTKGFLYIRPTFTFSHLLSQGLLYIAFTLSHCCKVGLVKKNYLPLLIYYEHLNSSVTGTGSFKDVYSGSVF